ncbi:MULTISPECIES: glycerophosphodiester phosphodiesterase family protein [Sphingobacterium]|uniref:Glycerophosphodiester phosphodiesterase family protein n=1 Tax=Sphingobacterium tenebrionis TaxID=3111775 RepID=A0ABU8I8C2_9SPHI|nr:glycerophosphodiester phosphodiesterase family protein [Sphingobacterium sp. CZ-2]QBR12101.1 glycerophosphodiester phosphodiesterase family protein [Sphingobacterium sp. CZ-2]
MNPKKLIFKGLFAVLFIGLTIGCFRGERPVMTDETPKVHNWFNINTVDELYEFLTYEEGSIPLVSAHRGGPHDGYPENCLTTIGKVAGEMPAIMEIDIAMTKDSVLVLMHDETLNRTSTGKGKVSNKTFAQLQELKLKDNDGQVTDYVIPTLKDILYWGKGKVLFTLDIKKSVPYEKVLEVVREAKAEASSIIITYSANQASAVNKLAPDLMISATIKNQDDLTRLSDLGIPDNRLIAFVGTSEPDSALYSLLRQHGIKSILGTMGNLDKAADKSGFQRYAELVERGADVLSTDRPFEAWKALDFYIKKRSLTSTYINW